MCQLVGIHHIAACRIQRLLLSLLALLGQQQAYLLGGRLPIGDLVLGQVLGRDLDDRGATGGTLGVYEHVLAQVITAQELLLADGTREVAIVVVYALVTLELVRTRERLPARLEVARVRSHIVVAAQMRTQMRCLVVLLGASVTPVRSLVTARILRLVDLVALRGRRRKTS
jgi:hypothetical protein